MSHDATNPNMRLRWWKGSAAFFDKPLLELQQSPTSQLLLELVTTRQIKRDEEFYLDYGEDWRKKWADFIASWTPEGMIFIMYLQKT